MMFRGYFKKDKERIDEYFPRDNIINDILDLFLSDNHVIGIRGFRRSGKSTLIQYLLSFFAEKDFHVAYIDIANIKDPTSLSRTFEKIEDEMKNQKRKWWIVKEAIKEGVSIQNERIGRNIDRIYNYLSKQSIQGKTKIYAFDEVQSIAIRADNYFHESDADLFIEFVNKHIDEDTFIIFTGSQIGTFNRFLKMYDRKSHRKFKCNNHIIDIGQMSLNEINEFLHTGFQQNDAPMPDAFPEKVYETIGGFVGYVSEAARMLLMRDMKSSPYEIRKQMLEKHLGAVIETKKDDVFSAIEEDLYLLDETLGVGKGTSLELLKYVARYDSVQKSELFDEIQKRKHLDNKTFDRLVNILDQMDLITKERNTIMTYPFIRNYYGGIDV